MGANYVRQGALSHVSVRYVDFIAQLYDSHHLAPLPAGESEDGAPLQTSGSNGVLSCASRPSPLMLSVLRPPAHLPDAWHPWRGSIEGCGCEGGGGAGAAAVRWNDIAGGAAGGGDESNDGCDRGSNYRSVRTPASDLPADSVPADAGGGQCGDVHVLPFCRRALCSAEHAEESQESEGKDGETEEEEGSGRPPPSTSPFLTLLPSTTQPPTTSCRTKRASFGGGPSGLERHFRRTISHRHIKVRQSVRLRHPPLVLPIRLARSSDMELLSLHGGPDANLVDFVERHAWKYEVLSGLLQREARRRRRRRRRKKS
mmetsp:Transcript_26319/g.48252  ORF Transcript_26319/g.48252 Transcript_26319/m.48252 type:complete len:314 (+) Transcript_26319:453-1394(+)